MNTTFQEKVSKLENFEEILVGLDIGGTLVKLSVAVTKNIEKEIYGLLIEREFEEIVLEENNLYIKKFHTSQFPFDVIDFLKLLKQKSSLSKINVTGGGAFKFNKLLNVNSIVIKEELKLNIEKRDELISLVKGYTFMNKYETFYELKQGKIHFVKENHLVYPHIAVNVGSGISILIVNSPNEIRRETGTLIGGGRFSLKIGTLLGLAKILIGIDNFDDIMKLAEKGDNKNVDLLIKDIYGGSAKNLGEDIIASR